MNASTRCATRCATPSDFDGIAFGEAIFRGSHLGLAEFTAGSLIAAAGNGRFRITADPGEAVMVALDGHYVQALP